MSGGPSSYAEMALAEAPSFALLIALVCLPLAALLAPRLPRLLSAVVGWGALALSAGAFAWGALVTGVRGMEPVWLGAGAAGFGVAWRIGDALFRNRKMDLSVDAR